MNGLLVEDDPDVQIVARAALKRAGFAVTVTSLGSEAIAVARTQRPDVILLDWMMPDMDGPEACRRLKADASLAAIPVIFLTARSQQAEIARGLASGAIGYIVKPFDALTLGEQLRDILGDKA